MSDAMPVDSNKHGCFFYGCLSALIVMVVLAVGGWLAFKALKRTVMNYTAEEPAAIETVTLSPDEAADLNVRMEAFSEAMRANRPGRLMLTADEINAKIGESRDFANMGGKAFIRIEGDQILADLSIPTERFGLPGRYLNGTAKIRAALGKGRLQVFLDEVEVKGRPLPERFMRELRGKNLAEEALKDPKTADTIAKLKSLIIENGVLTLEK